MATVSGEPAAVAVSAVSGASSGKLSVVRDLDPGNRERAEAALTTLDKDARSGDGRLLSEYVQSSPLCAELFALWESMDANENGRMSAMILDALAAVLEGEFEAGARTSKTRSGIAGRIISERLASIYRYLNSERDGLLRACLRLLSAAASQSVASASQLFRAFNWEYQGFLRLVGRRSNADKKGVKSKQDKTDVRHYFKSLALAFVQWNDPALTASVLGIKGFVSTIFGGLGEDQPEEIVAFLKVVEEHILDQRQVPRPTKLFFFNGYTLRHICNLLSSDSEEVVQQANTLLVHLATRTFLYRSPQHQLLLDTCLHLRPLRGPQQTVIIAVLTAHPPLHDKFLSKLSLGLQPNLSLQWMMNMHFLVKLLEMDVNRTSVETQPNEDTHDMDIDEPQLPSSGLGVVPKTMQKTLLSQALQSSNAIVLLTGLRLLSATLSRARRALADKALGHIQRDALQEQVQQSLPNLDTLLLIWQKLLKEDSIELKDLLVDTDVDISHVNDMLGLPTGGFPHRLLFQEWCGVVEAYCESLPLSMLDVKFDWSKLLAAASAPLLAAEESDRGSSRTLERLLPCIRCVDMAMHGGGNMQGMQLSRSQLAWVETMTRVRTSIPQPFASPCATSVATACDEVLHRCFHRMVVFTDEEHVEMYVWMHQLRQRPVCIPFFCFVLQLVASKPGSFAALSHETLGGCETVIKPFVSCVRPSLIILAAVKQLAQKETYAFTPPAQHTKTAYTLSCAQLVQAVAAQLGAWLPHGAPQLIALMRGLGTWNVNRESSAGADSAAQNPEMGQVEEQRQATLKRLEKTCSSWTRLCNSIKGGVSPSMEQCEECVLKTLQDIIQSSGDVKEDRLSLSDLRPHIIVMTKENQPCIHIAAYTLLEGVCTCCALSNYELACRYLLILIDTIPSMVASASPVLAHASDHSLWLMLAKNATLKRDKKKAGFDLCMLLALNLLCRLLDVSTRSSKPEERKTKLRTSCTSIALPLLSCIQFGPDIDQDNSKLMSHFGKVAQSATLEDPARAAVSGVASLAVQADSLEHLVGDILPQNGVLFRLYMIRSLLCVTDSSTMPFMKLGVVQRVDLLRWLVNEALAGGPEATQAEEILHLCISADSDSFLQFALTATIKCLWPKQHKDYPSLERTGLPLLEKACRMNVALRRTTIKRLDWTSYDPRLILRLGIAFAPLESSLPFLHSEELAALSAQQFCPLPPYKQLHQLLTLHPSPVLRKALRKAAAKDTARGTLEACALPLLLDVMEGKATRVENSIIEFLASSQSSSAEQQPDGQGLILSKVQHICEALSVLKVFSNKLSSELQAFLQILCPSCPEAGAMLLGHLLSLFTTDVAQGGFLDLASQILAQQETSPSSEWILRHALQWASHLSSRSNFQEELYTNIRKAYRASLTPEDRLRRQLLLTAAGANLQDQDQPTDAWSFRRWCGALPHWGDDPVWTWVLDSQRVRTTYDQFRFARPMVEAMPSFSGHSETHATVAATSSDNLAKSSGARSREHVYDIGYVIPFVAGQLRAVWAEHGGDSVESRQIVGPILSSIVSGGILELLLLTCACTDIVIRASAYESLSVVMVLATLWDDAPSSKDRDSEQVSTKKLPFKELPQIMRLLYATRDALGPPPQGGDVPAMMPTLVASFLCACVPVLLQPEHNLYMGLGMFFLGQSSISLDDIPLFYKLILSGQSDCEKARLWMFRVIRRGLPFSASAANRLLGNANDINSPDEFLVSDTIDNNKDGGNHVARVAIAHRYVLQWLLSFASSSELSNYSVWAEAVACIEAAFADPANGLQAAHRFGLCEWVVSQLAREWPGPHNRENKLHALEALTRLLCTLAHHRANDRVAAAIAQGFVGELLSLGGAAEATLRKWVTVTCSGDGRETNEVILPFWLLLCRLSELLSACAAKRSAVATEMGTAESAAFAAQLSSVLQQLMTLSEASLHKSKTDEKCSAAVGLLVQHISLRIGGDNFYAQALSMLRACPLSLTLQAFIVSIVGSQLQPSLGASPSLSRGEFDIGSSADLGNAVVLALGEMLSEMQSLGHNGASQPLRNSTVSLMRVLVMLPYPLQMAWRVQTLVCALTLTLHPDCNPDLELLKELPSPQTALAVGIPAEPDVVDLWCVSVSKVLKGVLGSLATEVA